MHRSRFLSLCLFCLLLGGFHSAAFGDSADQLFASGKFEAARQAYAAEAKTPGGIAPRLGLIRTLLRLDRWEEAGTEALTTTTLFPKDADAHGLRALALIRAGWQPPYADEAARSLALDAGDYWGLVASGRAADWDGKLNEARADFRKAAAAHPEMPDAWAALLVLTDETRDVKESLAEAQAYLKMNPQGHPHDEIAEDARDLSANATAYRTAFAADPPYQRAEVGAAPMPIGGLKQGALAVDFAGNYPIFPVTINGSSFHLLFDTGGGDDILLNWKAAGRLRLPPIAHSYVRGVAGKEKSDTLKAETMTLGGLSYKSIKIVTADSIGREMDGLIGGDILRDSVVTLDFEQHTAALTHGDAALAPAPLPGDLSVALPFHFYHGDLYLPVSLNTQPMWALLDTGAYETTLSLRLARQQLKNEPKDRVRTGTYHGRRGIGNTERRMDYSASEDESDLMLSQKPPVFIPIPTIGTSDLDRQVSPGADCDFEIGVWLGMSSLTYARRLTFDYPHRLLTFEYRDPALAAPKKKK